MLELKHLETLESMADHLQEQWKDVIMKPDIEAATIAAYAQACAAITQAYWQCQQAIRDDEPFLEIGNHFIRKSDIIRVEIVEENKHYNNPKKIRIYIREVDGGENYGSSSNYIAYNYDSHEASLVLDWLKGKTETLKEKCECCGEPIEDE